MKKSIVPHLPLVAITFTIVLTGIEVFQTGEENIPGMRLAEVIFVIFLAIMFGLGTIISKRRSNLIKKGIPVDDELSRIIIRVSAATTFFLSLILWIAMLVLEAHTDLESKFLIGISLLLTCLIFLIIWTIKSFQGHIK